MKTVMNEQEQATLRKAYNRLKKDFGVTVVDDRLTLRFEGHHIHAKVISAGEGMNPEFNECCVCATTTGVAWCNLYGSKTEVLICNECYTSK